MSKILVSYFSVSGVTKNKAKEIAIKTKLKRLLIF